MPVDPGQITEDLKKYAQEIGVDLIGITKALPPDSVTKKNIRNFLDEGRQGDMTYLQKLPANFDPRALLPDAKSIIVIGLNYYQKKPTSSSPDLQTGIIARYAHGRDYHKVLRGKIRQIQRHLNQNIADIQTKICVDSTPIIEKYYAVQAGLGFIGKNTTLINPKIGSFFVLGELLTDFEFDYDRPLSAQREGAVIGSSGSRSQAYQAGGSCAECTRCLEACPTKALTAPRTMDARKCISYLTIENKNPIPKNLANKMQNRIFGCDICQEVCPYNIAFAKQTKNPDFNKKIAGHEIPLREIEQIKSDEEYCTRFAGSPLMRAKRDGLQRNGQVAATNAPHIKGPRVP